MNQETVTKEYIYQALKNFNPNGASLFRISQNIKTFMKNNKISVEDFNQYILSSPYFYNSHYKNSFYVLIALSQLKNKKLDFKIPELEQNTKKDFITLLASYRSNNKTILQSIKHLGMKFNDYDLLSFMLNKNIDNLYHFKKIFLKNEFVQLFFVNSFIKMVDRYALFEDEPYIHGDKINLFHSNNLSLEQYKNLYYLINNFENLIKESPNNTHIYNIEHFAEYINNALLHHNQTIFDNQYIDIYKEVKFNPITFKKFNISYEFFKNKETLYNNELIINDEFQFSDGRSFMEKMDIFHSSFYSYNNDFETLKSILYNTNMNPFIPYKNNNKSFFESLLELKIPEHKKEIFDNFCIAFIKDNQHYILNSNLQIDNIKKTTIKNYIECIILDNSLAHKENKKKNRL